MWGEVHVTRNRATICTAMLGFGTARHPIPVRCTFNLAAHRHDGPSVPVLQPQGGIHVSTCINVHVAGGMRIYGLQCTVTVLR